MLVLSRRRDQSITIGDNILITVVELRGDKVRIGISAPIEIGVHRLEVYEAIKREEAEDEQHGQQEPKTTPEPKAPSRPARDEPKRHSLRARLARKRPDREPEGPDSRTQ